MPCALCMKNVYYSVGGREILNDFSFECRQGINLTILGASGVGKTTILKLLLGLLKPQQGEISINGVEITNLKERKLQDVRSKIAIVFQGGALFDSMTVGENVGYRLLEKGVSEKEVEKVAREKLSFVGLEHTIDLYPPELSGGMKKRAAIARALAAEPDFIFFDEPTTGLDPVGVHNIQLLIKSLQKGGTTTLMVTHDLPTAFAVSDRFIFIYHGASVFEGGREELLSSEHPAIKEFLSPADFASDLNNMSDRAKQ